VLCHYWVPVQTLIAAGSFKWGGDGGGADVKIGPSYNYLFSVSLFRSLGPQYPYVHPAYAFPLPHPRLSYFLHSSPRLIQLAASFLRVHEAQAVHRKFTAAARRPIPFASRTYHITTPRHSTPPTHDFPSSHRFTSAHAATRHPKNPSRHGHDSEIGKASRFDLLRLGAEWLLGLSETEQWEMSSHLTIDELHERITTARYS